MPSLASRVDSGGTLMASCLGMSDGDGYEF